MSVHPLYEHPVYPNYCQPTLWSHLLCDHSELLSLLRTSHHLARDSCPCCHADFIKVDTSSLLCEDITRVDAVVMGT